MGTVRVKKNPENPYLMIDKRPLNDEGLSWKAKGLLAYLLSKPDDWQVWVTDLVKRATDGEHAVRSGLQELVELGYASKCQSQGDDGKFLSVEWTIRELPLGDFPQAEKPDAEKPQAGNHQHTNNDSTNKEGTDNDGIYHSDPDLPDFPEEPKGYTPGPGKLVSCVDPDTDEEVGEADWRFPQTQEQRRAFAATGRRRFQSRAEHRKMEKIERKIEDGDLPIEFWDNRIYCATNFRWSFPQLLEYTLSEDSLREWERKQK